MNGIMDDAGEHLFVPQGTVAHQDAGAILQAYFSVIHAAEIVNPFLSCQTMDAAAQIAGFSMELPEHLQRSAIRAVESSMIEVTCQDGEAQITLRKGIGTQDISGDYDSYPEITQEDINNCSVTLKGSNGKIMVATWNSDGYTYAVRAAKG